MPPLGPEIPRPPKELSETEINEQRDRFTKEQELYGLMWSLRPVPEKKFRLFGLAPIKSAIATYPLADAPEHRKMTAWVEWCFDVPELKTQLIDEVDGEIVREEREQARAWVSTDTGNLAYVGVASETISHEEKMQHLNDIGDTLDLILNAQRDTLVKPASAL